MRRVLALFLFSWLLPAFAFAGSQTYSTPGTYTFTVPSYSSLTVQVWGAGGGGSSQGAGDGGACANGNAGGNSSFNNAVFANGGARGTYSGAYCVGVGGGGGTASGGTTNSSGNAGGGAETAMIDYGEGASEGYTGRGGAGGSSPNGGAGGAGGSAWSGSMNGVAGSAGTAPGGGGGGAGSMYGFGSAGSGGGGGGAYASKTYTSGSLTPGASITVVVASGGAGANGQSEVGTLHGGAGASGQVSITWTAPPASTCTVSLSPASIANGGSTTLSWTSANATTMYINNVGYVTANSSGSASVAPSSTTDYSCTTTGAGGAGSQAASLTVTPAPTCAVTFDTNPIPKYSSTVVHWTSSNASTLTLTTLGSKTPNTSSSQSVSPNSTTDYGGSVTGAGGASGSCPATLTVQCTPASTYTCSGSNVVQTATSSGCAVTTTNPYATCVAPGYCSSGSAACLYPPPAVVADVPNNFTGHLQARPSIVLSGHTTHIHWNVTNVSSCTVHGTNNDSWSATNSGNPGYTSAVITQQTVYTLTCNALDGSTYSESTTVNLVPQYQER